MSLLALYAKLFVAGGQILEEPNWPESWPFSPADFQRYDESKDERFYDAPRFVTHIDDGAIAALTRCARCFFTLRLNS